MIPATLPGCCAPLGEEGQDKKERTMSLGAHPSLMANLLCKRSPQHFSANYRKSTGSMEEMELRVMRGRWQDESEQTKGIRKTLVNGVKRLKSLRCHFHMDLEGIPGGVGEGTLQKKKC